MAALAELEELGTALPIPRGWVAASVTLYRFVCELGAARGHFRAGRRVFSYHILVTCGNPELDISARHLS